MNSVHHQAIPASTESYRASTRGQLYLTHVRKQCPTCQKKIDAKTLARFGGCEKCWEAK